MAAAEMPLLAAGVPMADEGEVVVAGRRLFAFQRHAVQWMMRKEVVPTVLFGIEVLGGLLCDDMGLGKTLQATALIVRRPVPRTLVVAPVAVVRQWQELLCEAGCAVWELQADDRVRRVTLADAGDGAEAEDGADAGDGAEAEDGAEAPAGSACARRVRYGGRAVPVEVADELPLTVVVASYGRIRASAGEGVAPLPSVAWDRLVMDEAHAVKNARSLTAQAVMSLARAPGCASWALTGTPVQSHERDLFGILACLGVREAREYALPGRGQRIWNGAVRATTRRAIEAWRALAMRRTMDDVPATARASMGYPSETYETHPHWVKYRTEAEAEFYRSASTNIIAQLEGLEEFADQREAAEHRLVLRSFLRLLAVHPQVYITACNKQRASVGEPLWPKWTGRVSKTEEVMELARGWFAAGHSFVLFTHYTEEARAFKLACEALGFAVLAIDGAVPAGRRHDRIAESRRLSAAGTPHALVVQIQAGGVGINLQHLSRVVLPSPDWVPAAEFQAIARCYRIGQPCKVEVHRFFLGDVQRAAEQIERRIVATQTRKVGVAREIVTSTARYL